MGATWPPFFMHTQYGCVLRNQLIRYTLASATSGMHGPDSPPWTREGSDGYRLTRLRPARGTHSQLNPMSCFLAWAAVLLLLPVVLLLYATATPQEHAKRLRAAGHTYQAIGARFRVHPSTARRWCMS